MSIGDPAVSADGSAVSADGSAVVGWRLRRGRIGLHRTGADAATLNR